MKNALPTNGAKMIHFFTRIYRLYLLASFTDEFALGLRHAWAETTRDEAWTRDNFPVSCDRIGLCPECGKRQSFDEWDDGYCDKCGWEAWSEYDTIPSDSAIADALGVDPDDPHWFVGDPGDDVSAHTMDADEIAARGLEHYERSL